MDTESGLRSSSKHEQLSSKLRKQIDIPHNQSHCKKSPTSSRSKLASSQFIASIYRTPVRKSRILRSMSSANPHSVSNSVKTPKGTQLLPLVPGKLSSLEPLKSPTKPAVKVTSIPNGPPAMDLAAVQTVVTMLCGYAKKLFKDSEKRRLLKMKCSARLRLEGRTSKIYAEQTILANLEAGIDCVETAIHSTSKEARDKQLENAERLLMALVLLDMDGLATGALNSYVVGWAHLYLALVWELRKNEQRVAAHLLEIFVACPAYARQDFAPELWERLFRPHFAPVELWYKRECTALACSTEYFSSILKPSPLTPMSKEIGAILQALCSPDGPFNSESSQMLHSTKKEDTAGSLCSEKLKQLQLLNKLHDEALNESTQHYAQYYQDWVIYYVARDIEIGGLTAQGTSPRWSSSSHDRPRKSDFSTHDDADNLNLLPDTDDTARWKSSRPQPLRKSLYDAIFGTSTEKSKKSIMQDILRKAASCDTGYDNVLRFTAIYNANVISSKEPGREERGYSISSATSNNVVKTEAICGKELLDNHKPKQSEQALPDAQRTSRRKSKQFSDSEQPKQQVKYTGFERRLIDVLQDPESRVPSPFESPCSVDATSNRRIKKNSKNDHLTSKELSSSGNYRSQAPTRISTSQLFRVNGAAEIRNSTTGNDQVDFQSGESAAATPPDNLVCSLTKKLYQDPVTLETGQTFERAAIQGWFDTGKTICPVTGLALRNTSLPMTNFVIKRLVEKWKEENLADADESQEKNGGPSTTSEFHTKKGEVERCAEEQNSHSTSELDTGEKETVLREEQSSHSSSELDTRKREIERSTEEQNSHSSCSKFEGFFPQRVSTCPEETKVKSCSSKNVSDQCMNYKNDSYSLETGTSNIESIDDFKHAVSTLCDSKELNKCEGYLLKITRLWIESKGDPAVEAILLTPAVISQLMNLLSTSKLIQVLKSSLLILSTLMLTDELTRCQILQADPELQCMINIVKSGDIPESALFLYLLDPPAAQIKSLDIVPLLAEIALNSKNFSQMKFSSPLTPRAVALLMMKKMISTTENRTNISNSKKIINHQAIPWLLQNLNADSMEERIAAVSILTSCMQADGDCRQAITASINVSSVVELLQCNDEIVLKAAVTFIFEIICLNRREIIVDILHKIQKEGVLNNMHVLMIHLQKASFEQQPLAAGLLLQLDLLVCKPHRYSVFREEALDALVSALSSKTNPNVSAESARVLASIGGCFSSSGESLTEAKLLKRAGLAGPDITLQDEVARLSETSNEMGLDEDEAAADDWDRKAARALLSYGKPLVEALGQGVRSGEAGVRRPCLVAAAWLSCFLGAHVGEEVMAAMRSSLEPEMVRITQPEEKCAIEERIFAALALRNYGREQK